MIWIGRNEDAATSPLSTHATTIAALGGCTGLILRIGPRQVGGCVCEAITGRWAVCTAAPAGSKIAEATSQSSVALIGHEGGELLND